MARYRDRRAYNREWYAKNLEREREKRRRRIKERRAAGSNWPSDSPAYRRRIVLQSRYQLTPERFEALITMQGHACAMQDCRSATPGGHGQWHIDHDHVSGQVRGLLCSRCNLMLGHYEKGQRRWTAFEDYLNKYQRKVA